MKVRSQVTATKLRGGYYTPPALAAFCWRRVAELCPRAGLDVLEPSAGDGAFFRNVPRAIKERIRTVNAVELDPIEAARCRDALQAARLSGSVAATSFLPWALDQRAEFDVVVGNPPFVRFQFVSSDDVTASELLFAGIGLEFEAVSNLWIPVLVGALSKLRPGGAASLVVPAELFTGMTAGLVRQWLLREMSDLSVDLFPSGKFPDVLQEVVVLSGVRRLPTSEVGRVRVANHDSREGAAREWSVDLASSRAPWTRLLLSPAHLSALEEATALGEFVPLQSVARIQVSIVTGANDFFSVSSDDVERFKLARWAVPLLPRIRHAGGLVWTKADQRALSGTTKSWLLDFSADRASPLSSRSAARYLRSGEANGLNERYKCRIRDPWYRVPEIWAGTLMLSKRSHRYPRLILNQARSFTTDTIYRGRMKPTYKGRERDLVAGFHNSVTLLTSELEGRSFGGGVHELVPSEIGRLSVPMIEGVGARLAELDRLARVTGADGDSLIEQTDSLVLRGRLSDSSAALISEARKVLMTRRLERGSSSFELESSGLLAG
ncbi:MAG TPA: class I SAM-dependent methyltransferase [Candidatus Limnocylindria bacterium]